MIQKIIHIQEPDLLFGSNQKTADPRDGLLLYGPYEKWGKEGEFNNYSVNAGIVGSKAALAAYTGFVRELKKPMFSLKRQKNGEIVSNELQRPSFPGFEAVFNIKWPETPEKFLEVPEEEIQKILQREKIKRIRTNMIVDLFLEKIEKSEREEDLDVNVWFVLVPKIVWKECRATKGKEFSSNTVDFFDRQSKGQTSLFTEDEMFGGEISRFLETSADFHNLLKARANQEKISAPLQVVVEPKLKFREIERNTRYSDDMKASIAWNISSSIYYKLGKKPWKISSIREGVCYVGLVFKQYPAKSSKHYACSAAQLFMSDGDGAVFRGNNGLWLSENEKEFHLDESEAFNLLNLALTDFHNNNEGNYPMELFIHGRAEFSDNEWLGFERAIQKHQANTKLCGVVIKESPYLKVFREVEEEKGNYGVLRGAAVIISDTEAYLFTRGFVPRLNTSTSLETPNPLHVQISRGTASLDDVLADIMALTKLNYNSCIYGDGKPVTLRFSDSIGSILTATENSKEERRQFKYYI